jgi:hypothetical protein
MRSEVDPARTASMFNTKIIGFDLAVEDTKWFLDYVPPLAGPVIGVAIRRHFVDDARPPRMGLFSGTRPLVEVRRTYGAKEPQKKSP